MLVKPSCLANFLASYAYANDPFQIKNAVGNRNPILSALFSSPSLLQPQPRNARNRTNDHDATGRELRYPLISSPCKIHTLATPHPLQDQKDLRRRSHPSSIDPSHSARSLHRGRMQAHQSRPVERH